MIDEKRNELPDAETIRKIIADKVRDSQPAKKELPIKRVPVLPEYENNKQFKRPPAIYSNKSPYGIATDMLLEQLKK